MRAAGPLLDDPGRFHAIVSELIRSGHAEDDLVWSESCIPPTHPDAFATETIFVICNSGMQNKVARTIFERIMPAIRSGRSAGDVFGHKAKSAAIDRIWVERETMFRAYIEAEDKLAFCRAIPWIGGITCYHLAKNFGVQVAKPDVHLQRLAERHGTTAQDLCEELSRRTGFRVATVDLVLWRACAEGVIDGRTGVAPERRSDEHRPRMQQHELFEPVQQDLFG